ncbi:MAG TPA: SPW repeat protein [Candidatus Methylomirabilis sp.]|nr:SPW repeat protein [Candidatus Methylomirabilis sp.]
MATREEVHRGEPTEQHKAWESPRDWINLLLGAYLMLAPSWTKGAVAGWFVMMGGIIAIIAVWALSSASSPTSERAQIASGFVTILSPWLGGFVSAGDAAWTAWLVGVAVFVIASVSNAKPDESLEA